MCVVETEGTKTIEIFFKHSNESCIYLVTDEWDGNGETLESDLEPCFEDNDSYGDGNEEGLESDLKSSIEDNYSYDKYEDDKQKNGALEDEESREVAQKKAFASMEDVETLDERRDDTTKDLHFEKDDLDINYLEDKRDAIQKALMELEDPILENENENGKENTFFIRDEWDSIRDELNESFSNYESSDLYKSFETEEIEPSYAVKKIKLEKCFDTGNSSKPHSCPGTDVADENDTEKVTPNAKAKSPHQNSSSVSDTISIHTNTTSEKPSFSESTPVHTNTNSKVTSFSESTPVSNNPMKPGRGSLENWLADGGRCSFNVSGISDRLANDSPNGMEVANYNKENSEFIKPKKIETPPKTNNTGIEKKDHTELYRKRKSNYYKRPSRNKGIFSHVSSYDYRDLKKAFYQTDLSLKARNCLEKNFGRDWDFIGETIEEKELRKSLKRLQGPEIKRIQKTYAQEEDSSCLELF